MAAIRDLVGKNARQYGMLIALVLIVLLFEVLTGGLLLQPLNITNLIMQNSYVLILAIGMMLVIITGHIDLSVGSVVAFVGAVGAVMMASWGLPTPLAVVLCLALGALIGAWHGFWIAYVRIPAFIATLAGMLLFRGLTLIVLDGTTIAPLPEGFRVLGSGYLPDLFDTRVHTLTLLIGLAATALLVWSRFQARVGSRRHGLAVPSPRAFAARLVLLAIVINGFGYVLAIHNGIPIVGLVLLALIIGFSFVMNRTITGRHVYAVGGNEKAAMLSGVRTRRTTFWVFVTMGTLSALAGLVFMARLNAATPGAGEMFELDAIAAAFIGGASASGGVGTVIGAIIGALVMGVMNNGMSLIGLGVDWQQVIKGLVLLAAVAFDILNKDHLGLRRLSGRRPRKERDTTPTERRAEETTAH